MAAREAELLPVSYFHVVFTLPSEIGDIACRNKAMIDDLLFKAMLTHCSRPRHFGACTGMTPMQHAWGSAMTHHPHAHMIAGSNRAEMIGTVREFLDLDPLRRTGTRPTHRRQRVSFQACSP
jgi:hypothetical protein